MTCVWYKSAFVSGRGQVEYQKRTQTPPYPSEFDWVRFWCSTRVTRKKVWRQPHHAVLVRMEMEMDLSIHVCTCAFVYVSRLGLNSFPPPLTQSGSILGLQFHATYVPKMSYPYSHTEYNAPSRPKLASTSIHPQKIAFTVYLARTIFHPKLSPIAYTWSQVSCNIRSPDRPHYANTHQKSTATSGPKVACKYTNPKSLPRAYVNIEVPKFSYNILRSLPHTLLPATLEPR